MSENIPKRRKNCQYPTISLQDAIADVQNGELTTWEAAMKHNVPYQTLKHKIEGTHEEKVGAKTILALEDELELVKWIQDRAKMGFPLAKEEFLDAAMKIADRKGNRKFAEKGMRFHSFFAISFSFS